MKTYTLEELGLIDSELILYEGNLCNKPKEKITPKEVQGN